MRNFSYGGVEILMMCTALPNEKMDKDGTSRSKAVVEQTTADLGFLAAQKIIDTQKVSSEDIGVLIFLTKTPDYRGPATAMVLQNRLQIPEDCIVYDAPTGNGGFENALNLGMSLLSTSINTQALVVFGDTVSKQLTDQDMDALNLQDGATAILLKRVDAAKNTDISIMALSKQWSAFMVPSGGFRNNASLFENLKSKRPHQMDRHLHIDSSAVFSAIVPELKAIKQKVVELIDSENALNSVILINLVDAKLEQELEGLFQSEPYRDHLYLSSAIGPQSMASTIPLMVSNLFHEKELSSTQVISVSLGEGLSINIARIHIQKSTVLESINSDEYYDNGFVTHEM